MNSELLRANLRAAVALGELQKCRLPDDVWGYIGALAEALAMNSDALREMIEASRKRMN